MRRVFTNKQVLAILSFFLPLTMLAQAPGCPNVDLGPDTVVCVNSTMCVDLEASLLFTGETTSYAVDSIEYAPPYPFAGGTPLFVGIDDIFSEVIELPFDFCFYGNMYNQIVVGANGLISFDVANAGAYCAWGFNLTIPTGDPTAVPYPNSINGAYHDIDPSVSGDINYAVLGSYPCRTFVVNYNETAQFSCTSELTTQQIVIYETTNVIEVYIEDKPLCAGWNDGNSLIGVQGPNSINATAAPNRNTSPWAASLEAWRFTPNGVPNYEVNWYEDGNLIAQGVTVEVCPIEEQEYIVEAIYTNCNGDQVTAIDTVLVAVAHQPFAGVDSLYWLCTSDNEFDLNTLLEDGADDFGAWQNSNGDNINSILDPFIDVSDTYQYIVPNQGSICLEDSAAMVIVIDQQPDAGIEAYKLVCGGGDPFDMLNELNGNPDLGGYWIGPMGDTVSSTYIPQIDPVGTYTYMISGQNACPDDSEFLEISYQEPFVYSFLKEDVTCPGLDDGELSLWVDNGAVLPLSYSIDGGSTYNSYNVFTSLSDGLYDIYIQDGNGCVVTDEIEIGASADPIQVLASSNDVLCHGDALGDVSVVSIIGGAPWVSGYAFTWFHSGTDVVVGETSSLDVPVGGYYVVVQDSMGCQGTEEVAVEEPPLLTYEVAVEHISCYGASDGHIGVTLTGGGTPPYDLEWLGLGGNSNSDLHFISAGIYQLQVTDANNCVTLIEIEVTAPSAPLSALASAVNSISCYNEATGSAEVAVTGGTPPYNYSWSSGHVTVDAQELTAGIYDVTVTDDRGCEVGDNVTISENPQILSDIIVSDASCFGSFDGDATISSSGGYGTHTYNWSTTETTASINNLSHGDYWVVIEDELGCIRKDTAYIGQPDPVSIVLTATNTLCFGDANGMFVATVVGGTPADNTYDYAWSFAGSAIGTNSNTLTDLSASTQPYQLIATDSNACQGVAYGFIREPKVLELDTSELVSAYCVNIPTGSVSVVAEGGQLNTGGAYQFTWDTGVAGAILPNQTAGSYTVIVTDDNDCQLSMTIDIPLEETFGSSMTTEELNCYQDGTGTATVSTAGGYGPYAYYWNWPGGSENTTANSADNTKNELPAGISSVTITDVNGCTITNDIEVTQPDQLQFTIHKEQDESCSGDVSACDGELTFTTIGGTGEYTNNWYDLNTNLIGTETTVSNIVQASNLCADFYHVEVMDERGCMGVLSGSDLANPVEIVAGFPVTAAINPLTIINNIDCYGEAEAAVSVSNPNILFTYDWYVNGSLQATGTTGTNLMGGIITVQVTYQECSTLSEEITINQPAQIVANETVTAVNCNGGTDGAIATDLTGGTGDYTTTWSNAEETTAIENLTVGAYTLTVIDANNCEENFEIAVTEPAAITTTQEVIEPLCYGDDNGQATISIEGGTPPYTEDWQGANQEALSAGSYTVIVTDNNACEHNANVTLTQPTQLNAGVTESNGELNASASGGTPNYSYEWLYFGNSQQTGGTTYAPTEDGEYTLVLTDANGCEDRVTINYTSITSLEENESAYINIYPNPMTTQLVIEVENNPTNALYRLELIDARGRAVRQASFTQQFTIQRDNLAAGIYMLKVSGEGQIFNKKMLIQEP